MVAALAMRLVNAQADVLVNRMTQQAQLWQAEDDIAAVGTDCYPAGSNCDALTEWVNSMQAAYFRPSGTCPPV